LAWTEAFPFGPYLIHLTDKNIKGIMSSCQIEVWGFSPHQFNFLDSGGAEPHPGVAKNKNGGTFFYPKFFI
jgi:hypothetical protein